MRRRLLVYTLVLSLLIALLPALTRANGSTPAVSVVASSTQVPTGETFDLTVQISGAINVYGTSVDLVYDPTLLEFVQGSAQGIVSDGLTPDAYYTTILDRSFDNPARLSIIAIRLGRTIGGASGVGNLASFTFKTLKEGQATFTVNGTSLDVQMVDPANSSIAYSAASTGVTVQIGPAPDRPSILEPATGAHLATRTFEVAGTAPPSSALIPAIDGANLATINVGANGIFSFPLTVLTDGTYLVSVRESNVFIPESTIEVTVDTLDPVIGPITASAATQSTISGTVTELNLDQLFVQVNSTGEPSEVHLVPVQSDGSYEVDRVLAFGTNTIKVTAVDRAGNVAIATTTVDVADTSKPTLSLVSSAQQVGLDTTFTVQVLVTNPNGLISTDLTISYPNQLLEVVDAQPGVAGIQNAPGPLLGNVTANTVNAQAGSITYAASSNSGAVDVDGTLVTITFKAIAVGSAAINFATTAVQNGFGTNAAHFTEETNVVVVMGGTVTGQVALAGRGANARAGTMVKVVGHPISTVTAADGSFTLSEVPVGAQKLLIRFPNPNATTPAYSIYLARVVDVEVVPGGSVAVPQVALKGGDANGNNAVTISDLVILAITYNLTQDQQGYDPRADFNGDGRVSIADLVILAGAYQAQGDPIPTGE